MIFQMHAFAEKHLLVLQIWCMVEHKSAPDFAPISANNLQSSINYFQLQFYFKFASFLQIVTISANRHNICTSSTQVHIWCGRYELGWSIWNLTKTVVMLERMVGIMSQMSRTIMRMMSRRMRRLALMKPNTNLDYECGFSTVAAIQSDMNVVSLPHSTVLHSFVQFCIILLPRLFCTILDILCTSLLAMVTTQY